MTHEMATKLIFIITLLVPAIFFFSYLFLVNLDRGVEDILSMPAIKYKIFRVFSRTVWNGRSSFQHQKRAWKYVEKKTYSVCTLCRFDFIWIIFVKLLVYVQVPFLAQTGQGLDTTIKQTTTIPTLLQIKRTFEDSIS